LSLCSSPNFSSSAECANILISYGADAKASATIQGKGKAFSCVSAIIDAQGPAALLDVILKNGGNPNEQTDPHGPILNHCIIEGFIDSAIVLLNNGANPNTVELENGATCLASAITSGLVDVVKLLLQKGANPNQAIMKNQKVTAKELAKYVAAKSNDANVQEIARILA